MIRRRKFVVALAALTAVPYSAGLAQSTVGTRRIAVNLNAPETSPISLMRRKAFEATLIELGWAPGRNIHIDYYWSAGVADHARRSAAQIALAPPDAVVVTGTLVTTTWLKTSTGVPTVFVMVPDPVGSGIVDNLARPGGNVTGFTQFEFSLTGKWLELLQEINPHLKRAGVLRDLATPSGMPIFAALQTAGQRLNVEIRPINYVADSIEKGIRELATIPNSGLIVTPNGSLRRNLKLILGATVGRRLPAIYPSPDLVHQGGLMSYGPDQMDFFRSAARYVDRILRGETAANLPVQTPTRYQLSVNLKTARAIGITVPPTLLARADEVIE